MVMICCLAMAGAENNKKSLLYLLSVITSAPPKPFYERKPCDICLPSIDFNFHDLVEQENSSILYNKITEPKLNL